MLSTWILVFVLGAITLAQRSDLCFRCPNGWMVYEQSCYLFADELVVNWTEATHFCESKEANLVVIESREEDQMMVGQANKLYRPCGANPSGEYFWIGATDRKVEGQWVWYTNQDRLAQGYTNWAAANHEPDNVYNQNCALMYGPYHFQWGSGGCGGHGHPICEKNMTDAGMQEIIG